MGRHIDVLSLIFGYLVAIFFKEKAYLCAHPSNLLLAFCLAQPGCVKMMKTVQLADEPTYAIPPYPVYVPVRPNLPAGVPAIGCAAAALLRPCGDPRLYRVLCLP
jgi:hypothetical protein